MWYPMENLWHDFNSRLHRANTTNLIMVLEENQNFILDKKNFIFSVKISRCYKHIIGSQQNIEVNKKCK